ncbi:MAG: PD-(D/E)XK nuclease family protein [Planctomycetota bacterium]|nr:PD-(D/E)XK nuclease family protein [Planctomycetota bacterium]
MTIYSHSRLGTFETCPRQYWYSYVGKPEIETVDSVEAFLGTRVHEALEELYSRLMGGQVMSPEGLLGFYEQQWKKEWYDGIHIVSKTFKAADYREVGQEALKAYYKHYHPFTESRTIKLEAKIVFDLDAAGKYRLQGYIDRVAQREDGTYEVHDYKTNKSMPTQKEADADRQLALYQIGVQGMWNDVRGVDLIWHYVRFDKELRSRRTPDQLEGLKNQVIVIIDDIEGRGRDEASFPTNKSNLCDWCGYREICPATRHHVAVAALPPKKFKADDGVSLVDQWVAARNKRRLLEAEASTIAAQEDEIQAQLIAFASQQRVESVAGSSHHVDVVEQQMVICPGADDENREAFEKAIRRAGIWDDVTSPNLNSFKALWKSGDLPAPARRALKPFVNESTRTVARLKKGGSGEE